MPYARKGLGQIPTTLRPCNLKPGVAMLSDQLQVQCKALLWGKDLAKWGRS